MKLKATLLKFKTIDGLNLFYIYIYLKYLLKYLLKFCFCFCFL